MTVEGVGGGWRGVEEACSLRTEPWNNTLLVSSLSAYPSSFPPPSAPTSEVGGGGK